MDPAAKRVIAVVAISTILGLAMIIYFDQKTPEAQVVSNIENVGFLVNDNDGMTMNVTLEFSVLIENYGRLREVVIPCSEVQSYLQVKNSTIPLLDADGAFATGSSYILDTEFTTSNCDDQASVQLVSENLINQLVAEVSFRFVSGTYSFVWFHSFADTFGAATVVIDTSSGSVTTFLETQ
ncbi:MAG: hypothetical protein ACXAE3_06505 [Candidatus Kariarchaeaceae archaeon]|jgi:hypothetical protein